MTSSDYTIVMRCKLIELEDAIKESEGYLLSRYFFTEMVLSQIEMILDFGLANEKIELFFQANNVFIQRICELVEAKKDMMESDESFIG